jgi:hypothetical protein
MPQELAGLSVVDEDYVWVSLRNAMKAKQSKVGCCCEKTTRGGTQVELTWVEWTRVEGTRVEGTRVEGTRVSLSGGPRGGPQRGYDVQHSA